MDDLKKYVRDTKQYPGFKKIDFKWSQGIGSDFPKLSVKVQEELVTFGIPENLEVNEKGSISWGEHLSPEEVNEMAERLGEDLVFFDGRNAYKAKVGHFKDAVIPDIRLQKTL